MYVLAKVHMFECLWIHRLKKICSKSTNVHKQNHNVQKSEMSSNMQFIGIQQPMGCEGMQLMSHVSRPRYTEYGLETIQTKQYIPFHQSLIYK